VGLSASDLIKLAKNSFVASFLDDRKKQARLDDVDSYAKKFMD
jgi:adenosine deaminase